tara:strand:+ start:2690 stop:3313 length:624 start_codon:yes stop_codon:yes gene_type:complete
LVLENLNVLAKKQQLFPKFAQESSMKSLRQLEREKWLLLSNELIKLTENLLFLGKDHIADLSLLDTINQDLKAAMLGKDVVTRDTLRMLIADIKKFEIDEKVKADDAKISNLINKNVKQRRDSIDQFKNGGRDDLVATEEEQLNVILKYLPEQLSEKEIHKLVQDAIAAVSAEGMGDMGKLMGYLKPICEGKADMSIVSKLARELLG